MVSKNVVSRMSPLQSPESFIPRDNPVKLFWIENLRVFSTFAVVCLHVYEPVARSIFNPQAADWWMASITFGSGRCSIPIFLLISGFLLLDPSKAESTSTFYKKRLKRILVPLVFWSVIYLGLRAAFVEHLSLRDVITRIFTAKPHYHLWYLYAILCLGLLTPLFHKYIRSSSQKQRNYVITSILLISSLYSLLKFFFFEKEPNLLTRLFIPYIGYYLCGYQLRLINLRKISVRTLLLVVAGSIFLIVLGTYFLIDHFGLSRGLFFYNFLSLPVMAMSIAVFLLAYKAGSSKLQAPVYFRRIINHLAPATLGIYLFHPLLTGLFRRIGISSTGLDSPFAILLLPVAIFLLSYLGVFVLTKIPFLKYVI